MQDTQNPPTSILRQLKSHGHVASTTYMEEAYVADAGGYIDMDLAEQDELSVGDLLLEAVDPGSMKEAMAGADGEL